MTTSRHRWLRGLAIRSALGVSLLFLSGGRAHGFARTETADGHAFFWKTSCAPFTVYLNGFDHSTRSHMTANEIEKSVAAAAHAWSTDQVVCPTGGSPYLELVPTLAAESAKPPAVAWDGRNTVIFRTDSWSQSGSGKAYNDGGLALTSVTARLDGHIVDVDMEINAVDFVWMNLDPGVAVPGGHTGDVFVYDLQNALTHEFGHAIGMAHSCFDPNLNPGTAWPTFNGVRVPDCNTASASVMSPTAAPGDVNKRSLTQDDVAAVCEAYPPSVTPEACSLDVAAPGCAVAPRKGQRGGRQYGFYLALAGLASIALFRRLR